jgi:hypothetical protein
MNNELGMKLETGETVSLMVLSYMLEVPDREGEAFSIQLQGPFTFKVGEKRLDGVDIKRRMPRADIERGIPVVSASTHGSYHLHITPDQQDAGVQLITQTISEYVERQIELRKRSLMMAERAAAEVKAQGVSVEVWKRD